MTQATKPRPRILLLSAYHSNSHAHWCDGMMQEMPEFDWVLKTQPARHFSWRVRAAEWIWALEGDPDFEQHYDLIIATSLSGVAGLKATFPKLTAVPVWVYFHENQFAHPLESRQSEAHQISWQFSSFQNALCAERISFNTHFNRDTFFEGLRALLKRMPERLPGDPIHLLEEKSDVLPVPLSDAFDSMRNIVKDPKLIVWNHRWEWDKQPEVFLEALVALKNEDIPFRLAMLGAGGADDARFKSQKNQLKENIVCWGEVNREDYCMWVSKAGIGVSAACHDFQGLAISELALAGATIVAPRRLAYPECIPGALFYADDSDNEMSILKAALLAALNSTHPQLVDLDTLPRWSKSVSGYRETIELLLKNNSVNKE